MASRSATAAAGALALLASAARAQVQPSDANPCFVNFGNTTYNLAGPFQVST
jgi:hypothetical protein